MNVTSSERNCIDVIAILNFELIKTVAAEHLSIKYTVGNVKCMERLSPEQQNRMKSFSYNKIFIGNWKLFIEISINVILKIKIKSRVTNYSDYSTPQRFLLPTTKCEFIPSKRV